MDRDVTRSGGEFLEVYGAAPDTSTLISPGKIPTRFSQPLDLVVPNEPCALFTLTLARRPTRKAGLFFTLHPGGSGDKLTVYGV